MKNSDKTRIILLILFLAIICLLPFVVAPPKDWYIILTMFGVPTSLVLAFRLVSNKVGLSSKPKLKSALSYLVVGFAMFCLSAMAFYLSNYSWDKILLYSIGFGLVSVAAAWVNIFVWSKIKKLGKDNPSYPK